MTSQVGGGDTVVALAVLRSAAGRPVHPDTAITSENVHLFAPDPAEAGEVAACLDRLGFRVGPLLGISMSVEGERERFEESLGIELDRRDDGGWAVRGAASDRALHLPTSELPDAVADYVADLVLDTRDELHDGPDTSG